MADDDKKPATLTVEILVVHTNGKVDHELTAASGCAAILEAESMTPYHRYNVVRYLMDRYGVQKEG